MHLALRQAYQRARNAIADVSTDRAVRPTPAQIVEVAPPAPVPPAPIKFTEDDRIAQWIEKQKRLSPQLRDWNCDNRGPTVLFIQKAICEYFGVKRIDLVSHRRTKDILIPRQVAIYLARKMTARSLPYIGGKFGGRDHTTALHAVNKIEQMIAADEQFAVQVETIRQAIMEA